MACDFDETCFAGNRGGLYTSSWLTDEGDRWQRLNKIERIPLDTSIESEVSGTDLSIVRMMLSTPIVKEKCFKAKAKILVEKKVEVSQIKGKK